MLSAVSTGTVRLSSGFLGLEAFDATICDVEKWVIVEGKMKFWEEFREKKILNFMAKVNFGRRFYRLLSPICWLYCPLSFFGTQNLIKRTADYLKAVLNPI